MLTRNKKKQFLPGELECKVLAEFRKKKVAKKSPKKIDDPLFNLIFSFFVRDCISSMDFFVD